MLVVAVAFELQHAVDQVLEHARACDRAVLRHVADEEDRDPGLLGHAQQPRGRLTHLRDGARRRAQLRRVERLDGVDHADVRPDGFERRADAFELCLGEDRDVRCAAQALGPELDLRGRLLAGDQECRPALADRAQRAQQQRRFADTRLTADEDERGGNEPTAEHAVELGDPGGDPLGLLRPDLDQAKSGLRRGGAGCGRVGFLDQRPERPARRALAEPPAGRIAAVCARELGCRLRHLIMVGSSADADCV